MDSHAWLKTVASLGLVPWIMSVILNVRVAFARGQHRRRYAWAGLAVDTVVLSACVCSSIMQRWMGS
jgi:hypothetical protein